MSRGYRVAMVAACPFPCARGTPIRIRRMAEALARRGHDVHVVSYDLRQGDEPLPFTVHRTSHLTGYHRVEPGPTAAKLMLLDPMLVRVLRRVLREHPFDVIHAHHYEGLLVALRARGRRRIPIVYDGHTLLENELPYYPLGLPRAAKRAIGRLLDRRLPRRADHVIAVSDAIADTLAAAGGVPAERMAVIPNGVELEAFTGTGERRDNGPRLVFAGNLAPYQRIDLLFRSLRTVVDARADARLLIVGAESLEPYGGLADELGVRGRIDTIASDFGGLPAHLAAAHVALNPRTACAGVPQKLLNYMAAGKPIVSFAGSAKVLEHGRTGWLVPDEDAAAFGRAVLALLDDPELARALGDAARRHVAEHFSWERTAERVEVVYGKLTGGGTPRR
ncbi:MAG TPA: glycosyltransferase family 4 protein [Gemmatimonadales bacterium]|nr:glycosyltransferase family 4 protein [Gemmatimonadales bacterium]